MVYMDNSATTRQYSCVSEAMIKYAEEFYGNPSSLHSMGLTAENGVKNARKILASSIGAKPHELYFTSGGTEADNMALFGFAAKGKRRGNKIITTSVEHPAVLECCKKLQNEGFEIVYLNPDKTGRINLIELEEAIDENVILISVMGVNNETGAKFPLEEIYRIKERANKNRSYKIPLHSDMVQGFMKENIEFLEFADAISVSAHKIHGPKGIGALFVKDDYSIPALILGGGQENGLRSGTENVPAITGFAAAVEKACAALNNEYAKAEKFKKNFAAAIFDRIDDVILNGSMENSSPYILNLSFMGVKAEVLLHVLEQDGIYISTGSACSSKSNRKSHVLTAMGLSNERIDSAIRFSFGHFNDFSEIEYVMDKLQQGVKRLR